MKRLKKKRVNVDHKEMIQELSDPCNVIEHYESFIRKKKTGNQ